MTAIRLRSRAVSRCILSLAVVAGCGSGGSNPKPGPDQGGAAGSMMMAGGSGGGSAPMGGSGGSGGRGGMGGGAGGAGGGMAMGGSGGSAPAAGLNVLTQKYDNARTGWNAAEKMLTLANVNVMTFGKLFSQKVDGQIYAQPLYVSGVNIGGKPHNVVYVVTMHNTLYAFDADAKADPLFMLSVGPSAPKGPLCGCNDIAPEVGATATPVIDLASKTIYFTSKHAVGAAWEYHLNAIDIVSGMPKTGSPVKITGMVAGTGGGSSGGMLAFDAKLHHNRPGLLLQGGRIYIGFASHGDGGNYHGWVFAYDAATLDQKGQFNTSPNAQGAGIWSSGIGLVGDGENVYFSTGNGKTNPDPMNLTLGEALVKLDKDLKLVDWHIRGDYAKLDGGDTDYGMGGPLLMSKPGLLIAGGKDAWALVYDKTNLGKYKMDDVMAVLQKFKGGGGNTFNGMHSGSFIWWDQAQTVYGWPGNSKLLGFKLNGMKFDEMPAVVGPTVSPGIWSYGCMVGSSNADKDGIIWALTPVQDNPNQKIVAGKLRAFDAAKGALLWDSTTMKDRDDVGLYASYSYPTVANGKVYAPSWNGSTSTTPGGELEVYGLIK